MTHRTFHPATTLPTPGVPLIIELASGETIEGTRPNHVLNRNSDPDWRDMKGNRLTAEEIVRWAIK
ncbi:hypothetical protein H9C73_02965 [Marinobacterium sp. AK62]|uniref:Uncharacterized protein n=1 Tax=Marinobacterium alkalitolerans TaxID=1542925 RepID=A0ABS3Z8P8_9GAMM|nr:hypothetical protein [Marinobacterium alkalitolerans]MBP0047685.1 hypothetical protein [Marinobacterium alkalitolerans]